MHSMELVAKLAFSFSYNQIWVIPHKMDEKEAHTYYQSLDSDKRRFNLKVEFN